MAELIAPQSSLKALIAKGKEQSYLTYAEREDENEQREARSHVE